MSILCLVLMNNVMQTQSYSQIIKAVASDRASRDYFGWSVAISGDYAIVGAYKEDENASSSSTLSSAGSVLC